MSDEIKIESRIGQDILTRLEIILKKYEVLHFDKDELYRLELDLRENLENLQKALIVFQV